MKNGTSACSAASSTATVTVSQSAKRVREMSDRIRGREALAQLDLALAASKYFA
jgi:hypothetical protein